VIEFEVMPTVLNLKVSPFSSEPVPMISSQLVANRAIIAMLKIDRSFFIV
jgi:hypothetical protein